MTLPVGIEEQARSEPTGSLVVQLDDGRRAVLPRSYAEASTSLGYALTVFRSQGITVDHTFGLGGDSLYQEAGYTQLSRGRLSNNLYVASPENPRWEIGHHADDLAQRDALESLVDALSQNKEQTMARDRLPTWPAMSADDFASAYREHASLGQWIVDHAPVDSFPGRLEGSGAEGARTGAEDDVANLIAAQRREAWVDAHQAEIERWSELDKDLSRHEYRLGQAAAYSQPEHTAVLWARFPSASAELNGGSLLPVPSRPIGPAGTSPPSTRSALNPSTPSRVPTGRELLTPSGRQVSLRRAVRVAGPMRHGSRHCGIGSAPSIAHAPMRPSTRHQCQNHRNSRGAATSTRDATSAATSGCDATVSR